MPLKVVVADDEPLPRERLVRLLTEAGCEVAEAFADGTSLLEWLKTHSPEALFLDIRMPGLSGLDILAEIEERLPVVLVTAYTDYSIRAFEHAAFDYILKPVTAERVGLTLGRLARRAPQGGRLSWDQGSQPMPRAEESRRFPIKVGDGVVFLDLRRVTHFELADDWAWAWHQNERFRTPWTSLAEVEGAFPGEPFCRIQRHLLLRPMAVTALKPIWGRRVSVRVMGGMDLQVSRSMTPRLKVLLGA